MAEKVNLQTLVTTGQPHIVESKQENNSLLYLFILFLLVAIAAAAGFLVYAESQPSAVKAFVAAKDALVEVRNVEATVTVNYDLEIIPTEFQQSLGTDTVVSSQRLDGDLSVDTSKQQVLFIGDYKTISEMLAIRYIYDAGVAYIKYGDRDYIVSSEDKFKLITPQDFVLTNMLTGEENDVKYGYGSIDNVTGVDAYRYKYYPPASKISDYVVEFVGKMVRSLYDINPPVITASGVVAEGFEWRVWAAVSDYHPTQIQVKASKITIDLGELGTAIVMNFTAEWDLNSLNEGVDISIPIS